MPIYWSMLFETIVLGFLGKQYSIKHNNVSKGRRKFPAVVALLMGTYVIFFAGLRSGIMDTNAYIYGYEQIPSKLSSVSDYLDLQTKEKGFALFNILFKCLISKDYHVWLMVIAIYTGACVYITLYKKSVDYAMSTFLFIASCMYTWMFNGMRQFIVIATIFAFNNLITEKKILKFVLLVLFLSTFHRTAILWIPIYFVVQGKPWSRKQTTFMVLVILIVFAFISMPGINSFLIEAADYDTQDFTGGGSSITRILVASIPMILAFIQRKKILKLATPFINICINLSLITTLLYGISSVSNGILIGRLPAYFEIFNFILFPWLLKNAYKYNDKKILTAACYFFYLSYFYYQIVITWHLGYVSDILHIAF